MRLLKRQYLLPCFSTKFSDTQNPMSRRFITVWREGMHTCKAPVSVFKSIRCFTMVLFTAQSLALTLHKMLILCIWFGSGGWCWDKPGGVIPRGILLTEKWDKPYCFPHDLTAGGTVFKKNTNVLTVLQSFPPCLPAHVALDPFQRRMLIPLPVHYGNKLFSALSCWVRPSARSLGAKEHLCPCSQQMGEWFSGLPNQEDPMPRHNWADLCMDPSPMDTRPMFYVKAASTKGSGLWCGLLAREGW